MFRSVLPLSVVAYGLIACGIADAKTRVSVFWVCEENEISPNPGRHVANDSHEWLLDGNKVGQNDLGQVVGSTNNRGMQFLRKTAIEGGRLAFKEQWDGVILSIKVSVVRNSSCSANVQYFKFPGQRYYVTQRKSNGEQMLDSSMRATGVVCDIQEVS